ncbi:MAG: 30S ribosomal protein S1 [Planctomycetaceae bacterium]
MVDRNLIREFQIDEDALEAALNSALLEIPGSEGEMDVIYDQTAAHFDANQIVDGVVIGLTDDDVMVDIGYKSEGMVPRNEWADDELPKIGDKVEVLLEDLEDEFGVILLSRRKAVREKAWLQLMGRAGEDSMIEGIVIRKIKGGLLINVDGDGDPNQGVNVFLPASQVDIRRPPDIGEYIGQTIQCQVLKVDEARRNIVVSRRKLIEEQRADLKRKLMGEIEVGQVRKGVVKNIADFGAFVDLGGLDGLLHITDMSWGRISHPTEMVKIDDVVEVKILNVDREKEKIALGLKQKEASPWDNIDAKFPVAQRVKGEVVNIMSYGAFVKLEDGIEGLVHISEMSWTKRLQHPSEMVNIGDEVEVVVLAINTDKQEISLGMKQTQSNPWDDVTAKYPIGSKVTGTVRNLTNYGAFVELEEGVDGLLHVSDMSWTRKVSHASEMLKKGDSIECQIISVDENRKRIALGLKQLDNDPWETTIPAKYFPGAIVNGEVTKITNFGVFVQLEDELEGLLHISELAEHKVANPEDEVKVGEILEVRVLRVDTVDRKIGLSRKLDGEIEPEEGTDEAASAGSSGPLKGGMGDSSGPLFTMGTSKPEAEEVSSSDNEEAAPTEE